MKKILFLENEAQVEEYLKNKEKFKDHTLIAFTFLPEKLLSDKNIKFSNEDDYEYDGLYKGVYKESVEELNIINKNFKINYRGLNLFALFNRDLLFTITYLKKYERIIKQIIKVEKPDEISIFISGDINHRDREFSSLILESLFKGKINKNSYKWKGSKKEILHKIFGELQSIVSRTRLLLLKEEDNKIFFSGQKVLYQPIMELLLKNKKNKIFRFYSNLQKSVFIHGKYIPFYFFKGKYDPNLNSSFKKELIYFEEKIKNISLNKTLKIPTEIESGLKEYIQKIIIPEMHHLSNLINEIFFIFENKKTDIILLDNNVRIFEKAVIEIAKLFKIPTIVVQHGVACHPIAVIPIEADYFIAYGEETKKWLIKNKVDRTKVRVLGSPRYEIYPALAKKSKEKLILYAPDSMLSYSIIPDKFLTKKRQKLMHKMVIDVLKKFPDYKLVIKTRNEDSNLLPKLIADKEGYKNYIFSAEADNNLELIQRADILIVHESTMALEALLLDKDVVSISFKDLDETNPYMNSPIEVTYNERELENAIKRLIEKEEENKNKKNEFLKKSFYKLNKNSSDNVVSFINSQIKKKKENKSIKT